ncbi:hypothetical protein [Streptomyces sp. PSAA01]|uniref:hypothetical protein n=1 Tax=Streptomyces sp. PSAA01 TaxID=2912762 RepID=UPI001F3150F4|nr:hypothetical protein [Streptomyces sp. PSAA01]MCG0285584.1 hypothetical protein [Streptomyces sp. PSAA01]
MPDEGVVTVRHGGHALCIATALVTPSRALSRRRPCAIVTKRCTSAATTTTSSGSANQKKPCSQCGRRTLGRTATRTTSRAASSSMRL